MAPLKILFASTCFYSTNGYSKIGYELLTRLAMRKDVEVIHWGFQNFQTTQTHMKEREYPANIQFVDCWANEDKSKGGMGFGFEQITEYVDLSKPDVICIYNDPVVISNILAKLKDAKHKNFKMVLYLDQVYLSLKKEFIARFNESNVDFVICFTPYWEQIVKEQGLKKPTDFLQHGFNPMLHYPAPKKLARMHFGLKQDDFIVINTTRNQPRKRLDVMMIAWAEFVSKHKDDPVKLLIGTHPTQGAWNLLEIYDRELRVRGMTFEEGMKHVILIDNPQQLTDEDMNILYNTADVGLNTCQGAGFELTTFEHAGMGVPQIAPFIGGIRDFLDENMSIPVKPCMEVYTDTSSDGSPGCAEVVHPNDIVAALERYYGDPELRKTHGERGREKIIANYSWDKLADKLYDIFIRVAGRPVLETAQTTAAMEISLDEISSLEKNINIKNIKDTDSEPQVPIPSEPQIPAPSAPQKHKQDVRARLQAKLAAKKAAKADALKQEMSTEELLEMKTKIDQMIAAKA